MMTTDTTTVVREVAINAPAAKIFAALTKPEELVQWWGDDTLYRCENMEQDFRIGGKWRTNGRDAQGKSFAVEGVYRTIDPPRLLEYTWEYDWSERRDRPSTIVRFELDEQGATTRVRVTHSGFADAAERDGHGEGWLRVLGWLRGYVE